MIRQKNIRVYPPGYTGDNRNILNELLNDGWEVRYITPVKTDRSGGVIHDYIIEKTFREGEE